MASKRKFRDAWMDNPDFSVWLTRVEGNDTKAYCNICRRELSAEITAIKCHKSTHIHNRHEQAARNAQGDLGGVTGGQEDDGTTNDDLREAVARAEIKLACFIAEHNLSFNTANHMVELHKIIYPDSAIARAVKLKRTRCTDVVKTLGRCVTTELAEKLRRYKFSIIIDESTDVSTTKSLAVVVKFYDDDKKVISTNMLDLVEIFSADSCEPSGSTGRNLYDLVMHTLHTHNIPLDNLVGFAADGASNLMGGYNSVTSRLKISAPGLCVIKCICHSLHLCASEAAKTLPRNCEDLIRQIYTHFAHSAKRIYEFKEFQAFCKTDPHKILHPCQTRWLSFHKAIERVLEQWQPLKLYFTNRQFEERLTSVDSIVNGLTNRCVYLYYNFLDFALPKFTKLNMLFQRDSPTIHILYECATSLYKDLMRCFCQPSTINSAHISALDPCDESLHLPLQQVYLGAKLHTLFQSEEYRGELDMIAHVRKRCQMFLIRGCCEVRKRFDMSSDLLQKCSYFEKNKMLQANTRIALPSMTDIIHVLPRMYTGNLQDLDDQWRALPGETLPDAVKTEKDIVTFYVKLAYITDCDGKQKYALLANLALEILALPTSNAHVERLFSKSALVKTRIRNKLQRPTLAALLSVADAVKQAGGCVPFEPIGTMIESVRTMRVMNCDNHNDSDCSEFEDD